MSQPTARRSARVGTDAKRIEIKGDPAFFRRINYPAVAAGLVVAMAVYLLLGALVRAPGGALAAQSVAYFGISVLAMYAGGLCAGIVEPKYGVLNAPLVAVLYIVISFLVGFFPGLHLDGVAGPLGLGPMRIDRVFAADIPQLLFSTLGGYTAGWIEQKVRAPRRMADRGQG